METLIVAHDTAIHGILFLSPKHLTEGNAMQVKIFNKDTYADLDIYTVEPWGNAADTYNAICDAEKLDELDTLLAGQYPDGISDGNLNDLLWYDSAWLYRELDINK